MSEIHTDGNRNIAPVPTITGRSTAQDIDLSSASSVKLTRGTMFRFTALGSNTELGFSVNNSAPAVGGIPVIAGGHFDGAISLEQDLWMHWTAGSGNARLFIYNS